MRLRALAPALLALLVAADARAQTWRPVEVDVEEAMVNAALSRARDAVERAREREPAREPESLGEALRALAAAFMHVGRVHMALYDGRIVLQADVRVEAIFDRTWVDVDFDLEPRVVAPNVVELTVVRGRERWQGRDWEERTDARLGQNVRSLVGAMGSADGVGVRLEGGAGGQPYRIVADLNGVPALEGVQLTGLDVRRGRLTARGLTTREGLTLDLDPSVVGDIVRRVGAHARDVISWDAWVDVGRERPGHLTLHSTADLPWLPPIDYRAVFKIEAAGPHRVNVTLADLEIGGGFTNGFLSVTGIKSWILGRLYSRLDALEAPMAEAYERGDVHTRLSHDPARPEVRTIDLRPGWAGDAVVRPGFAIDAIDVQPGRVAVGARLTSTDTPSARDPRPARSAGFVPTLGAIGD